MKKDNIVKVYLIDISEHPDYEARLPESFMPKRTVIIGEFINTFNGYDSWLVINLENDGIVETHINDSSRTPRNMIKSYVLYDMYIGQYRLD